MLRSWKMSEYKPPGYLGRHGRKSQFCHVSTDFPYSGRAILGNYSLISCVSYLHTYMHRYGSTDTGYTGADATWDANMIYGCYCDLKDSVSPYMGPIDIISGVQVNNPKVRSNIQMERIIRFL